MVSRKEREREFKKQLIAEAAFQLFKENSFEAVTVQDIATAAEIGKGTLYQFFNNKDEILTYILAENMERLNQSIAEQCAPEENILQALDVYLTLQYRYHNQYGPLLMSLYRRRLVDAVSSEDFAVLLQKRQQKIEQVAAIIQRGIETGLLMEMDSYKMAGLLNNIIRGFCLGNLEEKPESNEESRDLALIKVILSKGILCNQGGNSI